jgi:hypothetical protein
MRIRSVPTSLLLFTAVALAQTKPPAASSFVPSAEFNKALPKWLKFSGEYRARVEGFSGGAFKNNNSDLYFLHRFRINMSVKPTPWLKFQFQGQDARVFAKTAKPYAAPFQDTMDLRIATVEIGDSEAKTFGLRVGRQELVFGEQRLVGHVSWLNTARTFDAARATFRYKGYKLDAFASTVVQSFDGQFNRAFRTKGDNFHGLYGSTDKLIPKTVVEPYVFWRVTSSLNRDFKTVGVRLAGKLPKSFDYGVEVVGQTGSQAKDDIKAWAGHYLLGYTTARLPHKPRLIAEYNYASGDSNPTDAKRGTFDQLYPTPHDKYGLADQIGWRNIHQIRLGSEFKPHPKLTLMPNYHNFWLASATDALYAVNSTAFVRRANGSAGKHVGQELDLTTNYAINKQVQIGMGLAHLFPGRFLKATTPGHGYTMPYVMLGYSF